MDEREVTFFINYEKISNKYKKDILKKCSINVKTGKWYYKGGEIYVNAEIIKKMIDELIENDINNLN